MRTILIALLLAMVAVAGCTDDEPAGDDPVADDSTDDSGAAPADDQDDTNTPPASNDKPAPAGENNTSGTNQAPLATLTASIAQGAVPVDVNFTIEGSDADGDALSWTLDLGDGSESQTGATVPATVLHSYTEVGSYNATLTVTDGNLTATQTVLINATAAAAAEPEFETITISGTISGYWAPVGGYLTEPNSHAFTVPAVASAIDFHLAFGATAIDLDYDVFTPDGQEAGGTAEYNDPVQGDGNDYEDLQINDAAALAKVGDWTLDIYSAGSVNGSYTMTITFTP